MKIAEVEEILKNQGFSEKLFFEFQAALKRVPKASRCQHCYTTACELPKKDFSGAIKMIEYGLSNCDTDHIDLMRSYLNLGIIYENNNQYINAKKAYENALESVLDKGAYLPSISMSILRMELHIANFSYSDHIKELYEIVCGADDFEKGFRHFIFYSSLAKMIISEYENNAISYSDAYNSAVSALNDNKASDIDKILNNHKYANEAKATAASIAYLTSSKKRL